MFLFYREAIQLILVKIKNKWKPYCKSEKRKLELKCLQKIVIFNIQYFLKFNIVTAKRMLNISGKKKRKKIDAKHISLFVHVMVKFHLINVHSLIVRLM